MAANRTSALELRGRMIATIEWGSHNLLIMRDRKLMQVEADWAFDEHGNHFVTDDVPDGDQSATKTATKEGRR